MIETCAEINCLTLKTKEIVLDVEGMDLWIDIAKLYKNREDFYANATRAVKDFSDRKTKVGNYLKLEQTKRYLTSLEKILKVYNRVPLKHGFVYKRAGRYGGTWLHKDLFLDFMRWLSSDFAVLCDQMFQHLLIHLDKLEESRDALKNLQRPLTDAIKLYLVDTGIKTGGVYVHFATQIKRFIGCPDVRDNYTKAQLDAARGIAEEYRAMIVHGNKTSLSEMNKYLHGTSLNLAWKK